MKSGRNPQFRPPSSKHCIFKYLDQKSNGFYSSWNNSISGSIFSLCEIQSKWVKNLIVFRIKSDNIINHHHKISNNRINSLHKENYSFEEFKYRLKMERSPTWKRLALSRTGRSSYFKQICYECLLNLKILT